MKRYHIHKRNGTKTHKIHLIQLQIREIKIKTMRYNYTPLDEFFLKDKISVC